MILNLPKIGSVRFRDDLTAEELQTQVNQLAKKYNFQLEESELTYGEMASRAFTRGTKQLGSVFGDVIPAMVAQGLGFDEVAKQQLAEAAETQEEINKYYAPQYPTTEAIKGPGDIFGFGLETLVEQVPNLLTSLIPGIGAKAVAARTALGAVSKRLIAEAAEKKLAGAAAEEFVTQGLKAAAPDIARRAGVAQAAGIYLGSYAQNAPEIFQNVYESTGQMDVGTALLFGAGSAALDAVVPTQLANQLTGPLRIGVVEKMLERSGMDKGILRSTTSSILRSFPKEFATEGAQEAISISAEKFVADNPQIFNSKDWNRIMEASIRGAIAGGGFGAVSGAVEGLRVKAQERRQEAEKAEQERKTEEAARLRKEAQELEDAANKQAQMELPGIDREGPAASLIQDPQFVAAKAAVDAKKKLAGMDVEPTPKAKPPKGVQLEMFTPEGELTKQAEKAATADEKRVAAQKKADDKRRVEEAKEAAARLRKMLSGTQMTLPGFSPEEIKAEEQRRTAVEAQVAETGQGDLFAGMPAATAPKPPETLIGSDKDALKAFGKQFGIGPTASILKTDGPLAGKDIANPQDAAEVKKVLEAYASGKPAAGAAEKIAEYLKRPEFQVAEVKDERVPAEAVTPGGEPGVPVYRGPEGGVGPTPQPTEPTAVGVEPTGAPAGKVGVRAAPVSRPLETKPRGRPKAEITPEQQQAKIEARKALSTESKNAGRRMEKALKTIEAPFDPTKFKTEEELATAAQAEDAKVIDALIDAYRVANDPAQRKNKPGQMAREIIENSNVTQRQREIAKNRYEKEAKPAKRLPIETTSNLYDDVYYDFTDAQSAAKYISQNGTAFERLLANRLMDSLKNVKLVLVSDPSDVESPEVRAEFEKSSPTGVYYKKIIYLNTRDGLNNETFLHEAVHAATIGKITSFENYGYRGRREREFLARGKSTQKEAKKYYEEMLKRADADPEYALRHANVIYTMRQLAENKTADVFNNLAEFFSYGLTNKDMQEFLMMAPGSFKLKSLFTQFVEAIRNLFGLGPQHASAFQDLLIITDQVVKPIKVKDDGATPLQSIKLASNTMREIGRIGTNMPELTSKTAESFKNAASNVPGQLQEMMLGILRLDNINTIYGKELPSIQRLLDAVEKRYGMQEKGIKDVNDKYKRFTQIAEAEPQAVERMNDMAYDARLAQVDLLDGDFKPAPSQVAEYSRLKGIYNSLPKDVQYVYKTIRNDYDNAIKEYEKILFGDPKTGDPGVVDGLEPSVANKLRLQYEARKRQIGYIPFLRRGDFWVEYTGDDNERYVHAFQSVRERQKFIDQQLKGKEHQIYQRLEEADYRKGNVPTTSFIAQLIKNLSAQGATPAQINELYQSYLALFPAESISKQFMKSDNIRGMERDIIRGYGDTMVKWSRKLAASKYIPEIDKAVEGIASEAEGKGNMQLDLVVNNIKKQQDFLHNPTYGNLVNALTSFSYFEYIAGNISSAIINLSTLPLFSWPMLGGKFGFEKASAALLRGSRISINGMEKDPRYRNLYNELMAHAQLEHTIAREVLEGRRQTTGEFNSLKAKLFDGLSKPFAMAERLNRGATAIAAYDLAKSSGMSEKDAIRYAITTVKDINTSGMAATAPRWMQTPLGRIFFTFKSFTYNSAFIIARTFHQAFKGESQDVKDMARRQLLGIYAMSYAFSGAKGLPFMSGITTFAEMIASLFGDDDEPVDVQADLRQFLGELGYKGPLNYFLNLEIANRTGIAQDIIYKDDPRGVAENGLFLTALKQALGPAGSYFWSAERAMRDMSEGQPERAVEALLPSFARNGLKGWRYMTEGALTAKGDPIDTDINLWNSLAQGVGFAPADLSATYEKLSAAKGYEREIEARRTKILNLYTMARKTGDTDLLETANERRQKFNAANPKVAITESTLQRSAKASKAAERNMLYGVRFNSKLRPEIEDKFFDDEED